MKKSEERLAKLLVRSIARAIKERFVRREEHDALVRRVEKIEQQIAALSKQS